MTATAYDRVVEALRAHVPSVKANQREALANCPAHDDKHPSLGVTKIEGSVLICCRSQQCETDAILEAIGLTLPDLYDTRRGADYRYDDGRVVHRTPGKQFRQSGSRKTPPQLYRYGKVLAAVAAGETIWFVEGEKDVHALEALGVVATTTPMGASNSDKTSLDPLTGAHVVIVGDRDEPDPKTGIIAGDRYVHDIATRLHGKAASISLGRVRAGKDPADHVAAGYGVDDIALSSWQPPIEVGTADQEQLEPREPRTMLLEFLTVAELRAKVTARGPRRWLIRRLWPSGTYGVHGAEQKAQKTWNGLDLVVSVASGTPWLGHFEIDDPGPVLVFVGEGGESGILRRIDAIAEARGLDADQLPIVVCARAPHLSDTGHMHQMREQLDKIRPRLVLLDPLYLSAKGAKLGDLYAMGELLERAQHACDDVSAALWVNHHHNRNREATGPGRMSGAGPAEWGRVLINAKVITRYRDPDTAETRVLTELDVIGGDIADDRFRVYRTIRADDPDDLDSPLHYHAEVRAAEDDQPEITVLPTAKPSSKRVYAILVDKAAPLTVKEIGDILAGQGRPLKKRTIQDALQGLGRLVEGVEIDARGTTEWIAVPTDLEPEP